MKFRPVCRDNYKTRLQHFLTHDLDKFMSALNDVQMKDVPPNGNSESPTRLADLNDMPVNLKAIPKNYMYKLNISFFNPVCSLILF